jgi:hypothetical protein
MRKSPKSVPAVLMISRDPNFFVRVPHLILTFSNNYRYVMFTYVFVFSMVSLERETNIRFCEDSRGLTYRSRGLIDTAGSDPAASRRQTISLINRIFFTKFV